MLGFIEFVEFVELLEFQRASSFAEASDSAKASPDRMEDRWSKEGKPEDRGQNTRRQ